MREIKFRNWNTAMNRMDFFELGDSFPYHYSKDGLPVKYKVMQYTGLKDKNGKEIYEGDIVRYPVFILDSNETHKLLEVVFNTEYAQFQLMNEERMFEFVDMEDIEICGNIYENPELLKSL